MTHEEAVVQAERAMICLITILEWIRERSKLMDALE
jgi:hypothetical protein